jgi:hypothetical protein
MPADERMALEPFRAVYETARPRIVAFARNLGFAPKRTGSLYDRWIFHPPKEIPFTLDNAAPESANSLWRIAHRYEIGASFAVLAPRLISCGVSEADAEHVLSMQHNVAGLHGTRFAIKRTEVRLRTTGASSAGRLPRIRSRAMMTRPGEDFETWRAMEPGDEEEDDDKDDDDSDSDLNNHSDDDK